MAINRYEFTRPIGGTLRNIYPIGLFIYKIVNKMDILSTSIGNNLNKRTKSSGGYVWRYRKEVSFD